MAEANHSLHHAQLRARMGLAVMTLARQRATTRVKEQFRARGFKVANMSHREIVVAAELRSEPEHRRSNCRGEADRLLGAGSLKECLESALRRVFAFIQNYEHLPRAKPTNTEEFNDDRSCADRTKPNTAPLADRNLSPEGVSDGGRGRAVDRGGATTRTQWCQGCRGDLARVSTWAPRCRALPASLVAD